jgi:hypothetical protein
MSQSESEHDRKVVEYWKKFSIYDVGSIDFKDDNDKNSQLPYEPTAVLASQRNTRKRSEIY